MNGHVPSLVVPSEHVSVLSLQPPTAGRPHAQPMQANPAVQLTPQPVFVWVKPLIGNTPGAFPSPPVPPGSWPVAHYEGPGYFVCQDEHVWTSAFFNDASFERETRSRRTRLWVENHHHRRNSHDWSGRCYSVRFALEPQFSLVMLYVNRHRQQIGCFSAPMQGEHLLIMTADAVVHRLAPGESKALTWHVGPEQYLMTVELLFELADDHPMLRYALRWGKQRWVKA